MPLKHHRYLTARWEEVRDRSGMTRDQIVRTTEARYESAARSGVSRKCILHNHLDNPFMRLHALRTMAADMRKNMAAKDARIWRCKITRRAWALKMRAGRVA